ncbi:CPBP family intramembrane glutamic endopeptidase [Alkalibacillus almallahensis]|uniref:CPBP family intramembrane glutamic endopeptidase n=1 Tax=Alkalibacillus almallahensis TaxID=1379154 RepID=UPI001421FC9F|nr:CPBP family intramembrane glutamic endopeptidase [Alkalibacillus almallahensis]NIK11500.1 membrane protease YdiL (CAAX protease family) [Alkalibacillus almallahensis]
MQKKKLLLFCLWLYGLSFTLGALVFGIILDEGSSQISVAKPFYMLLPLVSVIIVEKVLYKKPFLKKLLLPFRPNKWWLYAMMIPLFLIGFTVIVALIVPGTSLDLQMTSYIEGHASVPDALSEQSVWILLVQGFLAGITINAIFSVGEEVGWRGFLLKEFGDLGFWKASSLIGLLWGVWHAPLIIFAGHNYPSAPMLGVVMMTVFCILLTPLLSYVTIKAQSIWPAALFHGVVNGTTSIGMMVVAGGHSELINGLTGVYGFVVLIIVNIILFVKIRNTVEADYQELVQSWT